MSDLVQYFPSNPDPVHPGCMNSGKIEDGVVFSGIEPLVGAYTYVGRTNLLEATGYLFGMGAKEVADTLTVGDDKAKKEIARLKKELAKVTSDLDELKSLILAVVEGGNVS